MPDINDLTFTRVIDPCIFRFIPRYLFEQIDGIDGEGIDNLLNNGAAVLTTIIPDNKGGLLRIPNPLIHLVVMTDSENHIKGFFWARIDIIEKLIFVYACSVDKKYQSNTSAISDKVVKYLFGLPVDQKYKNRIASATTRPKAMEKHGWTRSKQVLMEITKENENVLENTDTETKPASENIEPT